MGRFIEGEERGQLSLMPTSLDEYVEENNPVRAVDAFIDELDLGALGFAGVVPAATGRPGYHPSTLLKLYLYGYLNRVQSSRRLEREAKRNVEVMWLTGRLVPDFKTIAGLSQKQRPRDPGRVREVRRTLRRPRDVQALVRNVESFEIAPDTFCNLFHAPLELAAREIAITGVDGLEFGAVDRRNRGRRWGRGKS